jgi:hypothetical protein
MTNHILVGSSGSTAKEAFENAKAQTEQLGVFASFKMVRVPAGLSALDFANNLLNDPSISPHLHDSNVLACLNEGNGKYLFVAVVAAK